MKDFFDGLIQHIKNDPIEIIYSAIIFSFSVLILFLLLYVYLFLRRWYYTSRIRRSGQDFRKVADYIEQHGKPINRFQRFFLSEFGEVFDIYYLYLFIGAVIGLLIVNLFPNLLEQLQVSCKVSIAIFTAYVVLCFPIMVNYSLKAFRELIRHGRIFLFVIYLIILSAYVFNVAMLIQAIYYCFAD